MVDEPQHCETVLEFHNESEAERVFDLLWNKADQFRKKLAFQRVVIEELVHGLESRVLPKEMELGKARRQVLDKLLAFSGRRALSDLHRKELHEWIDESLKQLKETGYADEEICEKAAQVHAQFNNIPVDPDGPLSIAEQINQYYADASESALSDGGSASTITSSEALTQEPDNASNPKFNRKPQAYNDDVNRTVQEIHGTLGNSTILSVLDDSVFQRLFRQTANALHPDKEPDEELRYIKQELMSDLLELRNSYDVVGVMQLHHKYVSKQNKLTPEDKQSLSTVLYHFMQEQQAAQANPVFLTKLHAVAYRYFYAEDEAEREERLNLHLASLDNEYEKNRKIVDSVHTVFRLSTVLDNRLALKSTLCSASDALLVPNADSDPDDLVSSSTCNKTYE